MLRRKSVWAVAAAVIAVLASALPALPTSKAPTSPVTLAAENGGDCYRTIEGVQWHFDPCIEAGEPLPPEVQTIVDQDRQRHLCESAAPTPWTPPESAPPTTQPPADPCDTTEPEPTTPTDTPTTVPPTLTSGPPSGDVCTAAYAITSSWPGGFQATVTVRNTSSTTINGWTVRWTFADGQTVTQKWNGSFGVSGATITVTPLTFNATLPPNLSTSFGFVGTWTGTNSLPAITCVPAALPNPTTTAPTPTTSPSPSSLPPTVTPEPTISTDPTPEPTNTPSPTSSDPVCEAGPSDAPQLSAVDDAKRDQLWCRDPKKVPDPAKAPVVLVAAGDSVTASHYQKGFSASVCGGETTSDKRGFTGNNADFSYAGRYATNNKQVVSYYNFARTGFTTTQMLGKTDIPGLPADWKMEQQADTCGNLWNLKLSPTDLAKAVVQQAKKDGNTAYFVTTGGINDTNWVSLLEDLVKCRALEYLDSIVPARIPVPTPIPVSLKHKLIWTANNGGGKAAAVPNGGSCVVTIDATPGIGSVELARFYQGIRAFNLSDVKATITSNAKTLVNKMLDAGADKVVWMLYYDLSTANLDIGNFAYTYLKPLLGVALVWLLPAKPVRVPVSLVDPVWAAIAKTMSADLNAAIVKDLPKNNAKLKIGDAAKPAQVIGGADLQETAMGGSPHPDDKGHDKLTSILTDALG